MISEDTLNGMSKEINDLTERCKLIDPALRCADLLRDLATGNTSNWVEVCRALRALDQVRYGWSD
jgi:hypothetical protein